MLGNHLLLSLFPGLGLLDRAFEEEGFCVVRGPDVLWGGDIRNFHPPGGKFDGVIGGAPCQCWSPPAHLVRANGHEPRFGNLIPEFERCVSEAQPEWFLMVNVPQAPPAIVQGYAAHAFTLNNAWLPGGNGDGMGQEQERERRFTFGIRGHEAINLMRWIEVATLRYTLAEACRLQGLPENFLDEAPFTAAGKLKAVANGVPLPMGRALARAARTFLCKS